MRADTPTSFRRLSLLLAAAFALAVAPDAAAQSELIVEPGPPGVLNDAIENDTARPADRVYVLRQGAYYGVTREINNQGYTLRIKAEGTEGTRPVIYPAPDNTGPANNDHTAMKCGTFTTYKSTHFERAQ